MEAVVTLTTDKPGWLTYTPGQEILCPAPTDRRNEDRFSDRRRDPKLCNRVLGEVGPGLLVHVRVHPQGDAGRPNHRTTTSDCKRCGRRIEKCEEHIAESAA